MQSTFSDLSRARFALHPADLEACRALLRNGSRTFHAASSVLPRRVRDPAIALYAFCRVADDVVDGGGGSLAAVAALHDRLDRCYQGAPLDSAADRAFAALVRNYDIPRDLPAALLEGFAWDAQGRQYATLDELLDYAARVAGTVGAMMSLIMGSRAPEVVARACDLGLAMQLTNIARDVGEDARAGRLYLPREWLKEEGIDPDSWLAEPVFSPALGRVVARLLQSAEELYLRAESGIAELPPACRPGMHAAGRIYAAIGEAVARQRFDSVGTRAYVGPMRKLALLTLACAASLKPGKAASEPTSAAAQFLVNAVTAAATSGVSDAVPGTEGVADRVVWVLDLFERLERRERMQVGFG